MEKYKHAIIVQVDKATGEDIKRYLKSGLGLAELMKNGEFRGLIEKSMDEHWRQLHSVVSAVENAAFKRGYYLSLGLVPHRCQLCDTCNPESTCKNPYLAKLSMESVGIDIPKTASNAGFEIKWGKEGEIVECSTLNGIVLID